MAYADRYTLSLDSKGVASPPHEAARSKILASGTSVHPLKEHTQRASRIAKQAGGYCLDSRERARGGVGATHQGLHPEGGAVDSEPLREVLG
jgi:hypothetical protein